MRYYGIIRHAYISEENGINYLCLIIENENDDVVIGEGTIEFDPGKRLFSIKTPVKNIDNPKDFIGTRITWKM